ncbi:MAG: glycosyl hydrolase 2 galactose-binding domain-containing protein [Phycisphaeraceae bacterium]
MHTQTLHENWTVRPAGEPGQVPAPLRGRTLPASVPGCIHTDLLAADLLEDPYLGYHELEQFWVGRAEWEYRTRFTADAEALNEDRVELVCDGLDTIATVRLNGETVGTAEDMHLAYRFDVKSVLREGENELAITFHPAVPYARDWAHRMGDLPRAEHVHGQPFNFIRKMACNFGWDWGPSLVTCGIWKPIRLEAWSAARIEAVRPLVTQATEQQARLDVDVDLDAATASECALNLTFRDPDGDTVAAAELPVSGDTARHELTIDNPRLWWPAGHGEQPLYELEVTLTAGGHVLDTWRKRTGLRTVELDTSPDEVGSRFALRVNGEEIFCRGANWIPDDCFPTRVTELRYRERLGQALGANMNMLRVWGGGIFETDTFYEICDELGLMVWQDFPFACAAYPEEDPFRSLVQAEVRQNTARLSRHPSLVIYSGCNENIWGYFAWGWQEEGLVEGRTWGPGYYFKLIPEALEQVDPSRPYWPASPWSGDYEIDEGRDPNAASHGNKHVWEAWYGEEYRSYRWFAPRFCSEFGFQGPATWATASRTYGRDALCGWTPGLTHRQRCAKDGDAINQRHMEIFFDSPDPAERFDDWQFLLQLNQARALTLGVEWFRSRKPVCMGTLYWQLNDCWPCTTWAAIDGDGRQKPLWYATRRFYAPRLLTIQPRETVEPGEAEKDWHLFAVNDTPEPWLGIAEVRAIGLDGGEFARETLAFDVPPGGNVGLPLPRSIAERQAAFVVADLGDQRAIHFWTIDRELAYPEPEFDAEVTPTPAGYEVTITAKTLLRDLCLLIDRLDPQATVSDQLVTLLPGESQAFRIATKLTLDEDDLLSPPVLQCANRFGGAVPVA